MVHKQLFIICQPMSSRSSSNSCQSSQIPTAFQAFFAWCHMVWNIPLVSLGQLSWFCPLPAPCALNPLTSRAVQETEKLKYSLVCAALLSNN